MLFVGEWSNLARFWYALYWKIENGFHSLCRSFRYSRKKFTVDHYILFQVSGCAEQLRFPINSPVGINNSRSMYAKRAVAGFIWLGLGEVDQGWPGVCGCKYVEICLGTKINSR